MKTKAISSQATHVTAQAARGVEGSENRSRAKAVMDPRAPRQHWYAEVGWLAGIIDGEGNLNLRRNRNGKSFSARLEIVSTSVDLLAKCVTVMQRLGVVEAAMTPLRKRKANKLGKKPVASVSLGRPSELLPVLKAVLPFLTEKQPVAGALIALFENREVGSAWTTREIKQAVSLRHRYMPRAVRYIPTPVEMPAGS